MELQFLTTREIWGDYDPAQQPSNVSTLSTETESHVVHEVFGFDVDGAHSATADIYYDDRWKDARAAVMLLRHCDGRNVSELIKAFLKDGYIVCVPDYSHLFDGKTPEGQAFCAYPECMDHLDCVETSVYETPWYVWCKLVRRCVTALCEREGVADERIAAVGIGTGADVAIMTAGTDPRIAALVTVDGGGYRWARRHNRFENSESNAVSDSESVFSTGVGAETYARSVTCPVLMFCPQISHETDIDRLGDTLSLVKSENKRLVIMRCADYQLTSTGFKTLINWLRRNFAFGTGKQIQPTIKAEVVENSLYLRFYTGARTIRKYIYVSFGEPYSAIRRWQTFQNPQKTGEHEYSVKVPVYDPDDIIIAYATFIYSESAMASTPIIAVQPSKMGIKTADSVINYSRVLYDNKMSVNAFVSITDDLVIQDSTVDLAQGPFGIFGVTATKGDIALIRSRNEMTALQGLSALHIDAYSPVARELEVKMVAYPDLKQYTARKSLDGGDFWQKLLLDPTDFKSDEGRNLPKFSDVKLISISNVDGAIFNNFLWV